MEYDKAMDNIFDSQLDNKITAIKECQLSNNIDSCLKCDKVTDCMIRKEYVKSVYESMNQGNIGGFEF